MKKIIYIPLDERPCNYIYPKYMEKTRKDIKLIVPPREILGKKKEKANVEQLWKFINDHAPEADGLVVSVEMMLYGGLLPSRLHQLCESEGKERLRKFQMLREAYPHLLIFASNLIMRTPKFNSADEEPDYYAEYGEALFKRAYLLDKDKRTGLNEKEKSQLQKINTKIPKVFIEDYERRRKFNVTMNMYILDLVVKDVINFLAIPQDDAAVYGYTAKDQTVVYRDIEQKRLQNKVMVYPGADEVGSTLVARMLNHVLNRKPRVYSFFSSTLGPYIVPLYEDRPFAESVKSHLLASGCKVSLQPEEADFILAINTPGKVMQEAFNQDEKDVTYSSYRQLHFFTEHIQDYLEMGKPVVLADSAFANGGDIELIQYLDDYHLLDQLISYKGWNTNCNTLGTSIAAGVFAFDRQDSLTIKKNLIYHILEDGLYQAIVRKEVTETVLPGIGADYFQLNNQDSKVAGEIEKRIVTYYQQMIKNSFCEFQLSQVRVHLPWRRMFEIGIDLTILYK
ncbi:DUF4127 family protein [Virgibacillus sp. Bac332]|uniref:DUF4127 family protein n=1 Tax=Virgibacillus sp. Bac332 TaxID=2419842 RepID=UPI000EF49FF7|nr:DUF4127 family protein [Virgibacillus sp. Bac332]